jgi:hypothetical protein
MIGVVGVGGNGVGDFSSSTSFLVTPPSSFVQVEKRMNKKLLPFLWTLSK